MASALGSKGRVLEFGEKGESLGELLQTVVQRGDQRNEWAGRAGLGGL